MADERKIVIEIKNSEQVESGEKGNKNEASDKVRSVLKTIQNPLHAALVPEQQTIIRNAITYRAVSQAISQVMSVGQYHIYKNLTLNEDYLAEKDVSNTFTAIEKVKSFGEAALTGALSGAAYGSVIPGLGTGAGAIIGTVVSVGGKLINEVINTEKTRLQQNVQFASQNYQSNFQQTRLGLVEGRGVTNQ